MRNKLNIITKLRLKRNNSEKCLISMETLNKYVQKEWGKQT